MTQRHTTTPSRPSWFKTCLASAFNILNDSWAPRWSGSSGVIILIWMSSEDSEREKKNRYWKAYILFTHDSILSRLSFASIEWAIWIYIEVVEYWFRQRSSNKKEKLWNNINIWHLYWLQDLLQV